MANKRFEPVSYRPFRTEPLLAEGLLAVAREGGDLERQVAAAMFRIADEAGAVADRQAERAGRTAGEQAALAGAPSATVAGDVGGNVALSGDYRQMAAAILRKEEGFRETPYWDVTAFRTGYGSDTITTADGKVVKVAKGMKVSRADAERDLARRIPEFEKTIVGQVGGENWARLPAQAKAALLSVGYNYGSLPGAVARAAKGGDTEALAGAVGALSANRNRRGREAAIIRSGPLPAGGNAVAGAPSVTVSGGGFRPTGRDTIYGRAFDEAGTKTYLSMLETEMRSTASQVYDRYRDDPVTLEKALGALKTELGRDHVFPEIMADYEVGFGRLAESYLGQARENFARKLREQDTAAYVERGAALATDVQKRLSQMDPADPGAADAIASAQAAWDRHFDDAADRGLLGADDAARLKIEKRRETALGWYGRQAEAKDADGVAAMRKEMKADFDAGRLEALDGEGWATLDAGLEKLETQKRAEAARLEKGFVERGNAFAARIAAGFEVDQGELAKMMLESGATKAGKELMRETFAKISAGRAIRDMTLKQARDHVAGLRRQYGKTPTPGELRTLAFAEGMLADKQQKIATDPVAYAEQLGIVPETPMLYEAADAGGIADTLTARIATAEEAASRLGTTPRYLKAGEAKALAGLVRADPEKGVGVAAAIVAGAGDRAAAVLAEFGQDAPMIAESGAIVAFGGSARAAEDVILGYGRADGKALKGLKPEAAKASFSGVAGDALALAPKDASRIERAAASIARKRIADEGIDPTSEEAKAIHAQAVHEAAGAVFDRGVQYGGFAAIDRPGWFAGSAQVLVPSAIRADAFADLVAALTDEDLAGLSVPPLAGVADFGLFGTSTVKRSLAGTLREAVPVAVAGGYAFAMGDPAGDDPQFVQGADGKVFVLDLLSMRDRLAPRVPGAFR